MFSSPLHFVIGIIAILKAGGAYVPIDPDLPISRLQYIQYDHQDKRDQLVHTLLLL
ncbi:MAG: hypothetical protein EB127_22190 [Alphaproteobacteria bacterium]|nr:hypothetical protein [Alphaproteobacteria bacterium]